MEQKEIIRMLTDTGMETETIEAVCRLLAAGDHKATRRALRIWRATLLDNIHREQEKLDRLDYFLRSTGF